MKNLLNVFAPPKTSKPKSKFEEAFEKKLEKVEKEMTVDR